MEIRQHIPNVITLGNLVLGFVAILMNDPLISPLLILTASILDLVDGVMARWLNAQTELGGQLDSFADLFSFGAAPAFIYYHHLMQGHWYEVIIVALFPAMGALRLAKFNLDQQSGASFKGLPIPGAGLLLAFIVYGLEKENNLHFDQTIILLLPLVVGVLMLVSWRMMSFKKIRNKTRSEKYFIGILVILSLSMILWLRLSAIPLIVVLYLLLSLIFWLTRVNKNS